MRKFVSTSFIILLLISSCSTSTLITYSWTNPETEAAKQYIFVAAITEDRAAKSTVEDQMAYELQALGIESTTSLSVFQPGMIKKDLDDKQRELMLEKIREEGCDGIITITLLKESSEARYVPGSPHVMPAIRYGFYGGFNTYYNYYHPIVSSPGYYTQDKQYFLETNFYDPQTKDLLWTAQTETYNPTNLDSFAEEFTQVILAKLKNEGLIDIDNN